MVFTVETKMRTSTAGFRSLLKKLNEACNTVVVSGVINGDTDATETAILNEFGGTGIYKRGPYAGQTVKVPARPFVASAIEHHAEEIIKAGESHIDFEKDINITEALNAMGKKTKELQENTLDSNGEGVPGWQKHNSPRTIETKGGLDKPLFTELGGTFPIDYELQKRSA